MELPQLRAGPQPSPALVMFLQSNQSAIPQRHFNLRARCCSWCHRWSHALTSDSFHHKPVQYLAPREPSMPFLLLHLFLLTSVNTNLLNNGLDADQENTKPNCCTATRESLGLFQSSVCCCDRTPDKSNIKKKGFLPVHTLREESTVAVGKNVTQLLLLQPDGCSSNHVWQAVRSSREQCCSFSLLLFIRFGDLSLIEQCHSHLGQVFRLN